jgi:ankyrin repeat protein
VLYFRLPIFRELGTRWLQQRLRSSEKDQHNSDFGVDAECGSLWAVEKAIAEARNLDGFVHDEHFRDGFTLLHLAAWNDHSDAVGRLLSAGADADLVSEYKGWSALFIAARNGSAACVKLLLANVSSAVDVNRRTNAGETALFVASAHGHAAVVAVLQAAGAQKDNKANNWMGLSPEDAALKMRQSSVIKTFRA